MSDEPKAPEDQDQAAVEEAAPTANMQAPNLEEFIPSTGPSGLPVDAGIDRVLDVTVPLTARIGVVRKTISEVIDLAPGSVIDFERASSEPIDLLIGDKTVARGEIVVVDDRYGIRIVEITNAKTN